MDINDFHVKLRGFELIDIEHVDGHPISFWILDDEEKTIIIEKAIAYCKGETEDFKVWSDYDFEEPSTDVYAYLDKGFLQIVNNMETLISVLHNHKNVFFITVDDDLI